MKKVFAGFETELTRKKIRNIYLRVRPDGSVAISAPWRVPEEFIEKFVESRRDWISVRLAELKRQNVREYRSGEEHYIFGEKITLEVIQARKNSVRCENGSLTLYVKENADREKLLNEWYRRVLRERIEETLPVWENITGLKSDSYYIRNMKTRWGTCNVVTRRICFNLQLAKLPSECLEYVVLHELAHIEVSNHGPKFCAILDKYMPCWRDIKKRMNNEYKYML